MAHVGFIGLGNMGSPMATNILKAGHELTVFDLSVTACEALVALGAKRAQSAADAAIGADYVIELGIRETTNSQSKPHRFSGLKRWSDLGKECSIFVELALEFAC